MSRAIEVGASVEYVRYMAGWATKITGQTLDVSILFPPGARYTAYTRKEPVGVVAAIVPWNFPLMIAVWKLIPALAAGCTIVLKPSPETPLTALRLAGRTRGRRAARRVQRRHRRPRVRAALASHPSIAKISFTGRPRPASWSRGGRAEHDALLARRRQEPDRDARRRRRRAGARRPAAGAFFNQGQVCAAASRIYVHRSKFRQLADGLAGVAQSMKLGAGLDTTAQINPLVSAHHRDKVVQHIEGARRRPHVLAGGTPADAPAGYYVKPAVIADPHPDSAIVRDEVFGPVIVVVPFDDADAVRLANASPYGLAASL